MNAKNLLKKTNGLCSYCGDALTEETVTEDHAISRAKFRFPVSSRAGRDNKIPACKVCNCAKGSLPWYMFKEPKFLLPKYREALLYK